jgi:hypothetical protein
MEYENLFEEMDDEQDYSGLDEEETEEQIVNPIARAMPKGYWFSEKSGSPDGDTLEYEFITLAGAGPRIIISLKDRHAQ